MAKQKEAKTKIQLKTPTQERSRQTVATILEACARLLTRESFYEVTTDKVAKEAGVSIGSLYQFFGNKESVVLALIKKIHEEDKVLITQKMKALQNVPADMRVNGMMDIAMEVMTTQGELRVKLQSIQNYLVDSTYMSELTAFYVHLLKQVLPPLPGRDPDKVAYLIVTLCTGTLAAMLIEKPNFVQDKALVAEMGLLLRRYLEVDDKVSISAGSAASARV